MGRTSVYAEMNFIDVTALSDSTVSSPNGKEFSDLELFGVKQRQPEYGTLELNQFVLDGSRSIFPQDENAGVPYWSEDKSGDDGTYIRNPVLEVNFTAAHSSVGLTLYFAGDVPAEILITWYTLLGSKIISQTFYPDATEFFCRQQVQEYGKVTIEFVRSSFPDRYIKMDHIRYGMMWALDSDKIKTAGVTEEVDDTGGTLSINTAMMTILDKDSEFDVSNAGGIWRSLQQEQSISITERIEAREVSCGTFYMDTWSAGNQLVTFNLIDLIGVMDKTQFYDGTVYDNEKAGVIIDAIMASCGITAYQISQEAYDIRLSGWLGIQSHREALHQVTFACGAVADCSRTGVVHIYIQDRSISQSIGRSRKFTGSKISLDEYVSGVAVSYSTYKLSEEPEEIADDVLHAGRSRIEFSEPYADVTVSAGTVAKVSTNYIIVEMPEAGQCIITGKKYEVTEKRCTARVSLIEAGERENIKEYGSCTLLDRKRAESVSESLLKHFELRQLVELRYINDGEQVGNWCSIEMSDGRSEAVSMLNSQTLDLTGGNIATARFRGYNRRTTGDVFCGEIYAGEEGII